MTDRPRYHRHAAGGIQLFSAVTVIVLALLFTLNCPTGSEAEDPPGHCTGAVYSINGGQIKDLTAELTESIGSTYFISPSEFSANYNGQNMSVFTVKSGELESRVGMTRSGEAIAFAPQDGKDYIVFAYPKDASFYAEFDSRSWATLFKGKRNHTFLYKNQAGANVPADGEQQIRDKMDEYDYELMHPGSGVRIGKVNFVTSGSYDAVVGFSTRNSNVPGQIEIGVIQKLDSEFTEHQSYTNNLAGNTIPFLNAHGRGFTLRYIYTMLD